jgi:hypothetical protein
MALLLASACSINVPDDGHAFILNVPFWFVCRGFGFITFADPASVDKVLAQGNHELDGKKVSNPRVPLCRINLSDVTGLRSRRSFRPFR